MADKPMPPDQHDDDISQLYQQGATEQPPAHLDELILKQARQQCPKPVLPPWWRRAKSWSWAISTAASVAVVSTLLWLNHNGYEQHIPGYQPVESPQPMDEFFVPPPATKSQPRSEKTLAQPATAEMTSQSAPDANGMMFPLPKERQLEFQSGEEKLPATDASHDDSISLERQEDKNSQQITDRPIQVRTGGDQSTRPLQNMKKTTNIHKQRQMALTKIDELIKKGELEAALVKLKAFRKTYPDFELPAQYHDILNGQGPP